MEIQAVIFDLGGVLLRTFDRLPRTQLAERYAMTCDELERLVFNSESSKLASLGRISVREHWEEVGAQLGASPADVDGIARAFFAGDRLDMELLAELRDVRPTRKTGLLSNAWDDLRQWLEEAGIASLFDEIVISAEVGMVKPQVGIYHLALERLGAPPEAALFVDDFIENVETARALGMHAVHFRDTPQALADINRLLVAAGNRAE